MKYLVLLILVSCGAIKNNCDVNGYNELCYGLLGDYRDGSPGKDGVDGKDGVSCSVSESLNGAVVTCGSNSVEINDGDNALPSPYSITEIIDPCGDYPGYKDEVLLKMYNGSMIVTGKQN